MIARLGLKGIEVHAGKISPKYQARAAGVITRAVASIPETLERVVGCLEPGGRMIFMKGPHCDPEIDAARASHGESFRLMADHAYQIPGTPHDRRLVVYERLAGRVMSVGQEEGEVSSHSGHELTSASNPRFKLCKELLGARGIRKHGKAILAGARSVAEIIDRAPDQAEAWLTDRDGPPPPDLADGRRLTWYRFSDALFRELDLSGTHAPLLLVNVPSMPGWSAADPWPQGCTLFVPFQDPENVGAVIRSAAAFGVARVVLLREAAHPFHPRSSRAAGPALFQVPLWRGPSLQDLEAADVPLFALASGGDARDLADAPWPAGRGFGLVPGVEGPGLPEHLREGARVRLRIPIAHGVESLNAATAVAVALYAWRLSNPGVEHDENTEPAQGSRPAAPPGPGAGSSGRMILVIASSTAAREPGMTRTTSLPTRPPTARLSMHAGPISAKLSIRNNSPKPGRALVRSPDTVSNVWSRGLIPVPPVTRTASTVSSPAWASSQAAIRPGSSGTIDRSTIACPASPARPTIKAPDVSVSRLRVSEMVSTAIRSDARACDRCSLTAWLMTWLPGDLWRYRQPRVLHPTADRVDCQGWIPAFTIERRKLRAPRSLSMIHLIDQPGVQRPAPMTDSRLRFRRRCGSIAIVMGIGLILEVVAGVDPVGERECRADRITLRGGGQVRGKLIADPDRPDGVLLLLERGKTPLRFQKAQILQVAPEPGILDEYVDRRDRLRRPPPRSSIWDAGARSTSSTTWPRSTSKRPWPATLIIHRHTKNSDM